jgi:hypothetical protein
VVLVSKRLVYEQEQARLKKRVVVRLMRRVGIDG